MLAGLVIFLSAFLLFGVQPLTAKALLPWFGGAASVWTTCVLAFQVLLLLGYGYAHLLSRVRRPERIHGLLALLSLASLPILPAAHWKPLDSELPIARILECLLATVGLPYFLLSSTSPLVSAWAARQGLGDRAYLLFGLSNAGAFLGLLGYPFLFEPRLTLRQQALGWSALYLVLAVLLLVLARRALPPPEEAASSLRPGLFAQLMWIAWPCCSNVLLLAFTSFLTQNVAPIPFLWVVPLALYLLSWILCFSFPGLYRRWLFFALLAGFWVAIFRLLAGEGAQTEALSRILPLFLGGLLVACCVCHGELAAAKPPSALLTRFYFTTSIGGALGGALVGVLAPHVFPDNFELPLGMLLAPFLLCLNRFWAAVPLLAWMAWTAVPMFQDDSLIRVRNFYACLKVRQVDDLLRLSHGAIHHGNQFVEPERQSWVTGYYGPESGIGRALTTGTAKGGRPPSSSPLDSGTNPRTCHRVGVIGLGAGCLAAYARPGDDYVFYEINPQVVALARSPFTYLKLCQARTEVVEGDARLALERESPRRFDLLALDAFAGDAVPLHLLTGQAFQLYRSHLQPDGLLALHISNRYLDLEPVVTAAAQDAGWEGVYVHSSSDPERALSAATWVLFGRPGQPVISALRQEGYPAPERRPQVPAWSDDHCSLWDVLDLDELTRSK